MALDDDSATLVDFYINNGSILTLVQKKSGLMQILVKSLAGKTITLGVKTLGHYQQCERHDLGFRRYSSF